ncbi:MAG: Alpha/beta hydrolase family protein [Pelotomaculum sp. PtaB.Bin104]|nr:MAG: Alpha/beta hydrolase family protein [Pelotomaculum sp. PtaB.Bin104]
MLFMKQSHQWQKVIYPNQSGINLTGLLYKKPVAAGTVIVVCHGFAGSKEGGGRAVAMAEEMGRLGYSTLLFDFTGCGESEGDFAGISLTRHIGDVKSSVDFCRGLGFERVITLGRSFGGTAALCLGRYGGRIAGVCTWAAPGAVQEVFARYRKQAAKTASDLFPISEEEGAPNISKGFFADLDRHDVYGQAALIAPEPLLVIHGEQDQTVPVGNAQAIFDAAGEPKEIKIIRGADHQFTGRYQPVWETFFGWLLQKFPV